MTLDYANEYLAKKENEIFCKKKFGNATYAAVVKHPLETNKYAIEIGLDKKPSTTRFLTMFESGKISVYDLKKLGFEDGLIKKLETDIIDKSLFSNNEIEQLSNIDFKLNELDINTLKRMSYSEEEANLLVNKDIIVEKQKTGKINKLNHSIVKLKNSCSRNTIYDLEQEYIEGGICISGEKGRGSGTLGCVFKMENDNSFYAITNRHVIDSETCFSEDDNITHPSKDAIDESGGEIGRLIGKVHWLSKKESTILDAGVIKLNKDQKIGNYTRCGKIDFKPYIEAQLGMEVIKSGRTTECTEGVIKSINATAYVHENRSFYRNQIMTSHMACPGDSGSILTNKNGNVLGLIFAKSDNNTVTFANHFNLIFEQDTADLQCRPKINFEKFINNKIQ